MKHRRGRHTVALVALVVASLFLNAGSGSIGGLFNRNEFTPYFDWRLYSAPREPGRVLLPHLVDLTGRPLPRDWLPTFSNEATIGILRALLREEGSDPERASLRLTCLLRFAGLQGTYYIATDRIDRGVDGELHREVTDRPRLEARTDRSTECGDL